MAGALAGIRVVDLTEYIAGPYCTMMLADMGADVVKIERPDGDAWRHTAPLAPYESRGYLGVNRGKRSIALDLERAEGREIAQTLAAGADVVVVNYLPGVAERLGGQCLHLVPHRVELGRRRGQIPGFLGAGFGQRDNHIDNRLAIFLAEHYRA